MISKELLSEVLKEPIQQVEINYGDIIYSYSCEAGRINIYEFAHKCKQWAKNHGYLLYSVPDLCIVKTFNLEHCVDFGLDTEIESIFRACQWILDNKETK
jgi:hypothetical protein